MVILKVFRITIINAPFGNRNKTVNHHRNWPQLKSMLFVEDRVHIKFTGAKEPLTLWCQFSSLHNSQNCQAVLLKARIVKQSNRIGTFDRLRFRMPLKYVLVESLASEEQPLAVTASYQNSKEGEAKRTQSVLSSDSQVDHEFIKTSVPLVTGPLQHINPEKITSLDLDNFMCYCIFGYSLPKDYYSVASKAFAAKYGV